MSTDEYLTDNGPVPYAWSIIKLGWGYSHTTAVSSGDGYTLRHTFAHGDHTIALWLDDGGRSRYWAGCWRWSGSWGGSGMETVGLCADGSLLKYAKGVRRRMRAKAKAGGVR